MGYGTNFLGHLEVTPPLNDAEADWLRAFAEIDRRHYSDPYDVAMNPRVVAQEGSRGARPRDESTPDPFASLSPRDGTPYPHLDWVPCGDGCCLRWNGTEKSRMALEWLEYLTDHFLRPGAHARSCGTPEFEHFTFDHQVNGMLAGERDDTGELFLIRARDSTFDVETLVPPRWYPW